MIVPGKVTRVFGTHYFDHFFDPITIPTFETSQGQNHVLAWTIKTETKFSKLVNIFGKHLHILVIKILETRSVGFQYTR